MTTVYTNPGLPGWYLITGAFTVTEEEHFLESIARNESENICDQIHTAKEFGWKFIPIKKKTKADYLGEFPDWLKEIWHIAHKSIKTHVSSFPKFVMPDHVLLNEYEPGDGCKSHIDDLTFWNDWVVGVSFGSGCVMKLGCLDIYVPQRSIYILTGDARYKLTHGIDFVKTDEFYGDVIERTKRISLTFRTIHNNFLDDMTKLHVKSIL
jgi:alkylated DNA repair dioxygenase AlkB